MYVNHNNNHYIKYKSSFYLRSMKLFYLVLNYLQNIISTSKTNNELVPE